MKNYISILLILSTGIIFASYRKSESDIAAERAVRIEQRRAELAAEKAERYKHEGPKPTRDVRKPLKRQVVIDNTKYVCLPIPSELEETQFEE